MWMLYNISLSLCGVGRSCKKVPKKVLKTDLIKLSKKRKPLREKLLQGFPRCHPSLAERCLNPSAPGSPNLKALTSQIRSLISARTGSWGTRSGKQGSGFNSIKMELWFNNSICWRPIWQAKGEPGSPRTQNPTVPELDPHSWSLVGCSRCVTQQLLELLESWPSYSHWVLLGSLLIINWAESCKSFSQAVLKCLGVFAGM